MQVRILHMFLCLDYVPTFSFFIIEDAMEDFPLPLQPAMPIMYGSFHGGIYLLFSTPRSSCDISWLSLLSRKQKKKRIGPERLYAPCPNIILYGLSSCAELNSIEQNRNEVRFVRRSLSSDGYSEFFGVYSDNEGYEAIDHVHELFRH